MIIGIDIGGTHTDGVLLHNGEVVRVCKVLTQHERLHESILSAVDELLADADSTLVRRIVFSTTLTTNLIAQKRYPPTGLILIPGPGMSWEGLQIGTQNWVLTGSVDHRGRKVAGCKQVEVQQIIAELNDSPVRDLAIVSKFSTRNPVLEEEVEALLRDHLPSSTHFQVGHRVATGLNFPRRVQTTWLNTAVHREYANFVQNVEWALQSREIQAQLFLLKADGGTMPLTEGLNHGVETIKSGPAASIMGFLALASTEQRTSLLLDIGGSTTDLALMTGGVPLFEPEGVQVNDYLTSVRGLLTRSIPYGGDSPVVVKDGKVGLAAVRQGPALAFGGNTPTLTDALTVAGLMQKGDLSRVQAKFFPLQTDCVEPAASQARQLQIAQQVIAEFCRLVQEAQNNLLQELNGRPVYTIHELLNDTAFQPEVLMAVGGPAEALLPGLAEWLSLSPHLPPYHHVANALGAAVARPTLHHTLYADTAQRFYTISGLPGKLPLTGQFTIADARHILWEHTHNLAAKMGDPSSSTDLTEITHEESFNIVRGFSRQGQIFKLEAQVKPGLDPAVRSIRLSQTARTDTPVQERS